MDKPLTNEEVGMHYAALRDQLQQAQEERDIEQEGRQGAERWRDAAIERAKAAERRLKYHHASYPLPKKPPQPVQLGDDYNPDLCRFCREADWEAPAEAQAQQKEDSDEQAQ